MENLATYVPVLMFPTPRKSRLSNSFKSQAPNIGEIQKTSNCKEFMELPSPQRMNWLSTLNRLKRRKKEIIGIWAGTWVSFILMKWLDKVSFYGSQTVQLFDKNSKGSSRLNSPSRVIPKFTPHTLENSIFSGFPDIFPIIKILSTLP